MLLKRIAAICFTIAFLMAILMYTNLGYAIISRSSTKTIFLISGALGLLLNLLSFRFGNSDSNFNFFYWLGSLILFVGLVFNMMHWPYGFYIIIAGMCIVGISFFYNPKIDGENTSKNDLLDDSL